MPTPPDSVPLRTPAVESPPSAPAGTGGVSLERGDVFEFHPTGEPDVQRNIASETVCGFKVAAYRETHPERGAEYGHKYSEHWSTPNSRDPRVTVERLFTETQLREALASTRPPVDAEAGKLREEVEELRWKLRMVVSHATGGTSSNINASVNDICVRITQNRNHIYQAGKDAALALALADRRAK